MRRERLDLTERHATLALALKLRPSRGRLRLVLPIQNERIGDVVSVGDGEQPRPQVVVLAFAERRVVAQPVGVEHGTIDDDRGMEERRREERRPSHGRRSGRHAMDRPEAFVGVEVDHRRPHDRRRRLRSDPLDDPAEPVGPCHVVGVHPCEQRAARLVEADVERARESQRLLVSHDTEAAIVDRVEHCASAVARAVVDDQELEVGVRLAEHAPHRLLDVLSASRAAMRTDTSGEATAG